MGNLRWVENLRAPYGPALLATQLHPVMFAVNGGTPRVYGQSKTHMGLTFLKVLDAGLVDSNAPNRVALTSFSAFMISYS